MGNQCEDCGAEHDHEPFLPKEVEELIVRILDAKVDEYPELYMELASTFSQFLTNTDETLPEELHDLIEAYQKSRLDLDAKEMKLARAVMREFAPFYIDEVGTAPAKPVSKEVN